MKVASVLIPLPVPEAFDYAVPEALSVVRGDQVAVPLGPRLIRGVVAEVFETTGSNRRLKAVEQVLDDPRLPERTLDFVEWAARWTLSPPGEMAATALKGLRAPRPRPERRVRRVEGRNPARPTAARTAVLEALGARSMPGPDLARAAGVSSGVVKGLVDEGVLEAFETPAVAAFDPPDPDHAPATLNPDQAASAAAIAEAVTAGGFAPFLLDGVTGSGKTEAYLEAAARVLRADPTAQVLILLPEIALTQAVIERITDRFGVAPAEWHSGVAPPRRRQAWEAVVAGRCNIVVGARSALFLPYANLRLIVVDEEHDGSFKQEEGLVYHGRDLAVARARIEGAAVVLASATPSLETLWNAHRGRYRWLKLAARHGAAVLPEIGLIDLRECPPDPQTWLSAPLREAIGETLARGEQSLLFLNRRGYAPVVLCRACGHRLTAPDTDSWLVEHRYTGRLVCHLTGFSMPKPKTCPSCGAEDSLVPVGPGVERVEEEVRQLFPQARTAVFSSDTVPDGKSARALIQSMADGEIDILVATQAAAKGHNFPRLTLVGVVDADLGLRGGDLRAAERTYQLLAQATGRAGRADKPGRALLQTWTPEHPVLQALAAGDRDAFVEAEMAEREAASLPPHGRLAALILSSENAMAVEKVARDLAEAIPNAERLEVYGPADAPLALVRGRRRKRLLVRADRDVNLQAFLRAWLTRVKVPASVRLTVDVDPYSFL
ncbi:Primosomal protein N' [Brevundimonas diminuta]|uniref:primosomal protein N' n=2 Tax=Brevundimonas diminuta TaxID=293 RepID=UPI000B4E2A2C|nr:primosomal protein N' [Brevundimonas diminuta]OWR21254.1 primosomal protein N' [Brevundimonas diminuta]WQE45354.1 primosomal protein N' [Brevundimonas diminuta]SPU44767.1 Primosomal protein N' [Brevundimonas diminuta]SUW14566.1 Primosomal protein N' [Brevundimonas diminuta]